MRASNSFFLMIRQRRVLCCRILAPCGGVQARGCLLSASLDAPLYEMDSRRSTKWGHEEIGLELQMQTCAIGSKRETIADIIVMRS